jgi:redox-sensitive bicupin YhaK (pirin superfamily)
MQAPGVRARVIAGRAFGLASPVATLSPLLFADVALEPGARLGLDLDYRERAVHLLEGRIEIDGVAYDPPCLLALAPARMALLGGAPLDGPRHLWWNFVSSRKERIEQAKADWKRDRFGVKVPGDDEFIPLPD